MIPIVPMFEWSCFNYPNCIETVGIYPNVSNCIQISLKLSYMLLPKLNENLAKFDLADELYPNVSNLCKCL